VGKRTIKLSKKFQVLLENTSTVGVFKLFRVWGTLKVEMAAR